jgi:SAM-dependent methyltransferase
LPGPWLRFEVARGQNFAVEEPVDAVFSSAALHWMSPPEAVAASVLRALKPGGRFVAEMGGKGNIATIIGALYQALDEEDIPRDQIRNPWYFPSIGEYASLLERAGFEAVFMHLFDRPTPLDDCPNGIADWVRMFGGAFLAVVPPGRRVHVQERMNALTRPRLYREGRWVGDYRRLRFRAVKLDTASEG